jgi:hypothetical protein
MKNMVAGFIVALALLSGSPALAQSGLGNILNEALGGFLAKPGAELQTWHGYFVQAKGSTMIARGEDGATYAVDMTAVALAWQSFALGQPVTLAGKPGTAPHTLVAARIDAEQADRSGRLREVRPFRTLHGAVDRVDGTQVMVRTTDNVLVPVDVGQLTGEAEFRARDGARIVLEPGPANTVVWIEREDRTRSGGRRDNILSGLPDEYRPVHGHRVNGGGTTMIFIADNGAISSVDMSAILPATWHPILLGQAVTLAAKPGTAANSLVAARLQADPADQTGNVPKRAFLSALGTVEAVQGQHIRFRTTSGQVVRTSVPAMAGQAAIKAKDRGVLTYERGRGNQNTGWWLDRTEAQPAAAVGARVAGPGEYQRIYGYVQTVNSSSLSLKADDGRILAVDMTAIDTQVRGLVREGDLVAVLGKTTTRADQFSAESIERQARR